MENGRIMYQFKSLISEDIKYAPRDRFLDACSTTNNNCRLTVPWRKKCTFVREGNILNVV